MCNLCLDKLAKGDDDDDDDDRRSIITSISSPFAAHQFGSERSFNLAAHPQSPFAASQLFSRTDEPFSLFSIAETKRGYARSDDSGFGSRPITPLDSIGHARFLRENPVPFRRALTEEDKEPTPVMDKFQRDNLPADIGSKTSIDFPVTVPVTGGSATNTVTFPVSSSDPPYSAESPGVIRSRFNSMEFPGHPPFIRSRVQSRLGGESFNSSTFGEPGWRTRRESTA